MNRNKFKILAAGLGLATVFIVGAACSNGAPVTPQPAPATSAPAAVAQPGAPVTSAPSAPVPISAPALEQVGAPLIRGSASAQPVGSPGFTSSPLLQVGNGQSGIWVNGEATVKVEPDLAILNIGVETTARTVAEANGEAATAMDAIVQVLRARGLEDRDIQTNSFNIWPQYEYREVLENGRRTNKQELVGFRVSNSASISVRDLDAIGDIIDEVATAGGDATRINGINFTVEDPKRFMNDLREAAVNDALAKAEQFAELTNVSVGRLIFITETGGSAPVMFKSFDQSRGLVAEAASFAPQTPISTGELQFRLGIQAVFDIL